MVLPFSFISVGTTRGKVRTINSWSSAKGRSLSTEPPNGAICLPAQTVAVSMGHTAAAQNTEGRRVSRPTRLKQRAYRKAAAGFDPARPGRSEGWRPSQVFVATDSCFDIPTPFYGRCNTGVCPNRCTELTGYSYTRSATAR